MMLELEPAGYKVIAGTRTSILPTMAKAVGFSRLHKGKSSITPVYEANGPRSKLADQLEALRGEHLALLKRKSNLTAEVEKLRQRAIFAEYDASQHKRACLRLLNRPIVTQEDIDKMVEEEVSKRLLTPASPGSSPPT